MVIAAGIRGIIKAQRTVDETLDLPENPPQGFERRKIIDKDGTIWEYDVKIGVGRIFAFFGGVMAGLLGVGGGLIYVPVLSSVSGLPIHIAAATSTAMIVVVSLVGFITRSSSRIGDGTLNLTQLTEFGLPLLIGSIIGARFGALKVKKINSRELLTFFWVIAMLAGIRILVSELV